MKKFFLSLPVILTLIFTLFVPFSVSAADSVQIPTDYSSFPSNEVEETCSLSSSFTYASTDECVSNYCPNAKYYLNFQFYTRNESVDNVYYSYSHLFWFNGSLSDLDVNNVGGIYSISTNSTETMSDGYCYYRNEVKDDSVSSSFTGSFRPNYTESGDTDIIFNSNTNTLYFKINGSWVKDCGIFTNIESNIINYKSGLDLEVKFNPNLSGNIDRIIDQNGVKAESDYFSMEVINHSSKNAQFLFAIVPEGEQFSYNSKDLYGVGLDTESLKSTFFYLSQEWVYSPTITSQLPAKRVDESTYSQITPWHFISGDSTIQHSFNWSQVNISKDVNYDAVVLAIPTAHDKASKVFLYDKNPHYLSLDDCVEVYRSTFSVENPVKYDSTCEDFGNYPSNGLSGLGKGTVSANAYVDKDTGEVVVEDVSAKEKAESRAEWEPGLIQNDISGFDLSSVKSILGESKAVFNFFGEALAFMPSWFWSLLILGISSIVVIGIIKALK